jgi:hypothetical protein
MRMSTAPNQQERNQPMTTAPAQRPKALFPLGLIVATPGALEACTDSHRPDCLSRHQSGDWGSVCAEDKETNDEAVKSGMRVLSAYPLDPAKPCKGWGENTLWLITEADRSVTTFLLPSEY